MHGRSFLPPTYPQIEELSDYTSALIGQASKALPALSKFESSFLGEPIEKLSSPNNKGLRFKGALAALERPLSDIMLVKYGSPVTTGERTNLELPIFERYLSDIKEIPKLNAANFVNLIEAIAADVNNEPMSIRNELNVITKPDHLGDYWHFLDWRNVKGELVKLHFFLIDGHVKNLPGCFSAPVFIGAFNCIHPFRDGNGRTGRILFNGIIQTHLNEAERFYIPLKQFMGLSCHGFELAMRESVLFGRWSTLIVYCCRIITVMKARLDSDSDFFW